MILLSPDFGRSLSTFGIVVPFVPPLFPFIPVSPIPLPDELLLFVPGTFLLLNILVELLFGSPVRTLPLYIYWLVVPPLFPFPLLFLPLLFPLLLDPFGIYLPLLFPPELLPPLLLLFPGLLLFPLLFPLLPELLFSTSFLNHLALYLIIPPVEAFQSGSHPIN